MIAVATQVVVEAQRSRDQAAAAGARATSTEAARRAVCARAVNRRASAHRR